MDIKKSAKAGQLVRPPPLPLLSAAATPRPFVECVQGHGKGPGPHPPLRPEILPDAHAITSRRVAYPDAAQQPADGRCHAGRHASECPPAPKLRDPNLIRSRFPPL
jgi:hypothetical protein